MITLLQLAMLASNPHTQLKKKKTYTEQALFFKSLGPSHEGFATPQRTSLLETSSSSVWTEATTWIRDAELVRRILKHEHARIYERNHMMTKIKD